MKAEVERWLSACIVAGHDMPYGDNSHVSFEVEAPTLEALCRAWLALDGAPSVEVTECNQLAGTPDFDYGDMLAAVAGLPIGTTVRIVPTPNTTTPPDPGHEQDR